MIPAIPLALAHLGPVLAPYLKEVGLAAMDMLAEELRKNGNVRRTEENASKAMAAARLVQELATATKEPPLETK